VTLGDRQGTSKDLLGTYKAYFGRAIGHTCTK
jgi:hypothetical protein